MKLKKVYFDIQQFLKILFQVVPRNTQASFRLDEVDLATKKLIIFCCNTRTFIRMSLDEAIFDQTIILNLSSSQACFLGYYYGKFDGVNMNKKERSLLRKNNVGFLLRFTKGRFKVVSLDRENKLTYIDTKSKEIYTELPFDMAQQELIISQFDPSQACYIGVLAGIAAAKQKSNNNLKPRKVILRLVK